MPCFSAIRCSNPGPDSFPGKIGKTIDGVVSNWDVKEFQPMFSNLFLCLVMKPFVMLVV